MAKKEIIELLRRYIFILNTEGIKINKAFLFGSYSDDSAIDSSDIDVMLVSENYDENDDLIVGKIWSLTRRVNAKIEPFLIGMNKFEKDDTSPLINMIKSKGIEIEC